MMISKALKKTNSIEKIFISKSITSPNLFVKRKESSHSAPQL